MDTKATAIIATSVFASAAALFLGLVASVHTSPTLAVLGITDKATPWLAAVATTTLLAYIAYQLRDIAESLRELRK